MPLKTPDAMQTEAARGRIGVSGVHKIRELLVISREVVDSKVLSSKIELRSVAHQTVISELEAAIEPVEQIEGLSRELEFPAIFWNTAGATGAYRCWCNRAQ